MKEWTLGAAVSARGRVEAPPRRGAKVTGGAIARVLQLQAMAGNAAVAELFARSMKSSSGPESLPTRADPRSTSAGIQRANARHKGSGEASRRERIQRDHATTTVQRLIINVGDDPLESELRKDDGWIIAKDIEIALRDGGVSQAALELNQVPAYRSLGPDENVYLVGHGAPGYIGVRNFLGGAPGYIGVRTSKEVASELNLILPRDYSGKVKSLSCSTGIGTKKHGSGEETRRLWSGVAKLAARLGRVGVLVEGAYGIALNHPAFEGGRRTVKPGKANWSPVEAEILKTQRFVDAAWRQYVGSLGGARLLDKFMTVPLMAEALSRPFYVDLEARIEPYLVPKDKDATIAMSSGTGISSIVLSLTHGLTQAGFNA